MNDQVTPAETATILQLATQCLELDGDFVELGCYKGMTSVELGRLLAKNQSKTAPDPAIFPQTNVQPTPEPAPQPEKRLWVYDSFAGLPAKTSQDASGAGANFQEGELLVTKREVVERLKKVGLHNVVIKKAWFNDLADHDLPDQIAFAFCDGDLYESIKTSLHLVLPRLTKQGIIIVHDYNNPQLPGSARAVDEFLRAHPEFRLQVQHTLAILR